MLIVLLQVVPGLYSFCVNLGEVKNLQRGWKAYDHTTYPDRALFPDNSNPFDEQEPVISEKNRFKKIFAIILLQLDRKLNSPII